MSNVYSKLSKARVLFQNANLKKSGKNKFAGYEYFELSDIMPTINKIFDEIGLCGFVSFKSDKASLTIISNDDLSKVKIFSPTAEASLKGCHSIQNLGAVQTYLRRYLWMAALEIVEHDALDSSEPVNRNDGSGSAIDRSKNSKSVQSNLEERRSRAFNLLEGVSVKSKDVLAFFKKEKISDIDNVDIDIMAAVYSSIKKGELTSEEAFKTDFHL